MTPTTRALLAVALVLTGPAAAAAAPLGERVGARLAEAGPGTRFGLLVVAEDGRELIAIEPDRRFMPASNTKLLTTIAAYAALPDIDAPDMAGGATVRLERGRGRTPDVVLTGNGDARLSSAASCVANCLAMLADAVASRTRRVRDVIGDDSRFPDERWSPGMSWNNIQTCSGTAIGALVVDDNELRLRVAPGVPGRPPDVEMLPYFDIDNRAVTVAAGPSKLDFTRLPGGETVQLTGTVAADAPGETLCLGIDDPAHFAAWRFRALLEARGVRVRGRLSVRHHGARPTPIATGGESGLIGGVGGASIAEDVALINKTSQNVHAAMLLRRLGALRGSGSVADGLAVVADVMARAGVDRSAWDLADGSGMSSYNRLSPRAVVTLLRWAAAQPWGPAWRASLAVAGVDGTLARRFRGTALAGRLFAKTGTLNATNALSGYLIARSGRTLTFAFFANDVPGDTGAAPVMDAILEQIAAEN